MIGPDLFACDIVRSDAALGGRRVKASLRQQDLLVSRAVSRQAINHLATEDR